MPKTEIPKLTKKQHAFLVLYRRLQVELGHAPSLGEITSAHGGYANRSGAQWMLNSLVEMGLAELPEVKPVGGGITKLGLKALKAYEDQE